MNKWIKTKTKQYKIRNKINNNKNGEKNNNHQTNKYIEWLKLWDILIIMSSIAVASNYKLIGIKKCLLKMLIEETFKRTRNNTFLEY